LELHTVGTPGLWIGFSVGVLALLAIDLGAFNRRAHAITFREATIWSFVWMSLAAAFCGVVYMSFGADRALEFATGYIVEEALSVDNLFVFLLIFRAFAVPASLQHRVLFWGILGALVLRAIFIFVGAALLQTFHWVMYVFGVVLVIAGAKLLIKPKEDAEPQTSWVVRLFRRAIPTTSGYRDTHFFVRENGRLMATPLLLVLVTVEATDVIFAVDSIPAIFGVTQDPFIVYTSNIFAILGLRSLYFVLAGIVSRFEYLNVGLGLVLAFVGAKMLLTDVFHIPIELSLLIIATLIGGSVAVSFFKTRSQAKKSGLDDTARSTSTNHEGPVGPGDIPST
jgi:tellurite resistance protein TerC